MARAVQVDALRRDGSDSDHELVERFGDPVALSLSTASS
jgi:hypothetical protein